MPSPKTADEVDISALRDKYLDERDKRLRADGSTQYLELSAEFGACAAGDLRTPFVERDPLSIDTGYHNNEGGGASEGIRSHLGEPYGRGFYAFGELLARWRADGHLQGIELRS